MRVDPEAILAQRSEDVAEPGMVFTIEPGLYIRADDPDAPAAFKGIGVRIEDDIVITNEGILNLNRGIPKKVDEIEAWVLAQD